jgi:hypothetical protein
MKLYIVATITKPLCSEEFFSDIILITDNETKAIEVYGKMKAHEPVEGLDYSILMDWDDVVYFKRELNKIS